MNDPNPSRWAELFDIAMSIIDHSNRESLVVDSWTFGGGTALMLQIDHRESHDIDLFIVDPQILPFLNPETQGFDLPIKPSSYHTDGTKALKIVFDGIGEIDVICSGTLTTEPSKSTEIRGRTVELETPAEIVAKKVVHRGSMFQPRDMFDLAAVARKLSKEYVIGALSNFSDKTALALSVTEKYDAELARKVLADLNVMADFTDLQENAQAETIAVLKACV